MKYKEGNKVRVFQSNKTVTIKNIACYQVDMYGTEVEMYEVEGEYGLYVDIYDGTVAKAQRYFKYSTKNIK